MSRYLVRLVEDDSIVSIIDWDGISPIYTGSYYYLENEFLADYTSSIDSSFIETTSSIKNNIEAQQFGEFIGSFEGDLIGQIRVNGQTLDSLFRSTDYGYLTYFSGSKNDYINKLNNDTVISSSYFVIDNEEQISEIILPSPEHTYAISSSINRVLKENIPQYIFKIKNIDTLSNREFLVTNTEINSINNRKYTSLSVTELNKHIDDIYYYPSSSILNYDKILNSDWYIDFDFGDKTHIGKFIGEHTGSFTGSFEGDAELTGSFFGIFKGLLDGTASNSAFSQTASFAQTASRIDVIQKSTNWTKPSWAKTIRVTCVGGGGGGGAAPALEDTMSLTTGGGGGGGGTITTGEFDARTLSDVISITVGAGGFGGIHDGTNLIGPSVGGDTYFGRYLIARGGNQGSNGMAGGVTVVRGGSSIANINYLNTGAGGGGAGTINGIMELSTGVILDASKAPPLPLPRTPYLSVGEIGSSYYTIFPTPVPAVIAPTGGGGGLGYDDDNGGRQDGITNGGKISPYQLTSQENKFASLTPTEYGSGSYEIVDSESIDLGRYPAYNTTIGLGGRGGNPYYIDIDLSSAMPTDGTMYGGGGGGAFGGGIIGRYTNGEVNGTPYNFGANGAQGVVVIISEA